MIKATKLPALLTIVAALALSGTAYGQASSAQTYGGAAGGAAGEGAAATTAEEPSSLPFTGLDLALMLGGAVVLGVTGTALGRLVARSDQV